VALIDDETTLHLAIALGAKESWFRHSGTLKPREAYFACKTEYNEGITHCEIKKSYSAAIPPETRMAAND
jgi:hypothetical protein